MTVIIDYGMGNVGSVFNMLKKIGATASVSSELKTVAQAKKLILPGVGAFDQGIANINSHQLKDLLIHKVLDEKTPFLGICLGAQLLAQSSEEGNLPGLGWIDAKVARFQFTGGLDRLKVPHMGWNDVVIKQENPLFKDLDDIPRFYFVHSYHIDCNNKNDVIATSFYGLEFVAALNNDNIGNAISPREESQLWNESAKEFHRTMLMPRVIPCLLLKGTGLVKTIRFKNPIYLGDPLTVIKIFNAKEVDELALLDITATTEKREPNYALISEITNECFMPLSYGGGVKSLQEMDRLFKIGIEKVVINTTSVINPLLIAEASKVFGSQSVVISVDVTRTLLGKYEVTVEGGKRRTGLEVVEFVKRMESVGAGEILLTAIERDGTMEGYDLALIQQVAKAVQIPVIASGGAGSVADFGKAVKEGYASAVAAGSIFVFQGKRRAVLISFPKRKELEMSFT